MPSSYTGSPAAGPRRPPASRGSPLWAATRRATMLKTKAEKADGLMDAMKKMLVRMNDKQLELTRQSVAAGLNGVPDVAVHRSAVHALGDRVLVSVVVPTMPSRRWTHRSLYDCFCRQTWPSKELIVLETGGATRASPFWRDVARRDERVAPPASADRIRAREKIGRSSTSTRRAT